MLGTIACTWAISCTYLCWLWFVPLWTIIYTRVDYDLYLCGRSFACICVVDHLYLCWLWLVPVWTTICSWGRSFAPVLTIVCTCVDDHLHMCWLSFVRLAPAWTIIFTCINEHLHLWTIFISMISWISSSFSWERNCFITRHFFPSLFRSLNTKHIQQVTIFSVDSEERLSYMQREGWVTCRWEAG